jgi:hypothetical protein
MIGERGTADDASLEPLVTIDRLIAAGVMASPRDILEGYGCRACMQSNISILGISDSRVILEKTSNLELS